MIHVEQAPEGFSHGDYNNDKVVKSADYVVWRNTLGRTGDGLAADGDWSGKVDAGDYNVWTANVGHSTLSGDSASAAVPEPGTILLLIFAVAGWCLRRHRAA